MPLISTTLSLQKIFPLSFKFNFMGEDHGRECHSSGLDDLHTPTPYFFHML